MSSVSSGSSAEPRGFLTRDECRALLEACVGVSNGTGMTRVAIRSSWTGAVQWARSRAYTSRDVHEAELTVTRNIRGASGNATTRRLDIEGLRQAVQFAERSLQYSVEDLDTRPLLPVHEPIAAPCLWSDTTYQCDGPHRGAIVRSVLASADAAGLHAAGELRVEATGTATLTSEAMFRYYPTTRVTFSTTVRDARGTGSGWAGTDDFDIARIDIRALASRAEEKCLASRNPVALEPGRYVTVLEPQAVADLFAPLFDSPAVLRMIAERPAGPFGGSAPGTSKIGQRVLDPRLSIAADPMDSRGGFLPFRSWDGTPYAPISWVEQGMLRTLAYEKGYALSALGRDGALPNSGSWHIDGGTTPLADLIASTKRGVLVTRFSNIRVSDFDSFTCTGYTRDGLWLIDNGQIAKPIKNFRFTESPLFAFNNVEALGPVSRVYSGGYGDRAWLAPAVKVRDFNFTQLADSV